MSERLPDRPHHAVGTMLAASPEARAPFVGLGALRAVTISHRTVGIGALSDHAINCEAATALHAELTVASIESCVLATCNRSEIYWRAGSPNDEATVARLFTAVGVRMDGALHLSGRLAAQHLFRVCAGLESVVLGEAEILGQVRAALAASAGDGSFIRGVVQAALRAGGMARAETTIGVGAQSVASAAVQILAGALPLAESRVLVVGAGATGMKAARHLRKLGAGRLVVANRTASRGAAASAALDAESVGLDQLQSELDRADAVVCALHAPEHVITQLDLQRIAAARAGRPFVVVDLCMPASVAPGEVDGIVRVDLQVLQREVERQRDRRSSTVPQVEAVIEREIRHLDAWARHHAMRPLMSDLRRRAEEIRRSELTRACGELSAGQAAEVAVLDRLSRRLLDQLLAMPLATLEAGDGPLDAAHARYLRRLFPVDAGA